MPQDLSASDLNPESSASTGASIGGCDDAVQSSSDQEQPSKIGIADAEEVALPLVDTTAEEGEDLAAGDAFPATQAVDHAEVASSEDTESEPPSAPASRCRMLCACAHSRARPALSSRAPDARPSARKCRARKCRMLHELPRAHLLAGRTPRA